MAFEFTKLDFLTDEVIDLLIEKKAPAEPSIDHVPAYHFKVTMHGSSEKIGEIRLRVGNVPSLLTSGHLGFSIAPNHRGHGYAARACLLVSRVARAHNLNRLIITCDPENAASRRTCEKVGARLLGVFEVPPDQPMYQEGGRRICRYEWILTG